MVDRYLLTINTGSSSLKAALYRLGCGVGEKGSCELIAEAERINSPRSLLRFQDIRRDTFEEQRVVLLDHAAALRALLDQLKARGMDRELVTVGLGNGASMTAVRGGVGVDTTMGFTLTGGLMMGTRSGDLDPGVLLHMLGSEGMEPSAVSRLVNREAGLWGVSGTSSDMRDLLEREVDDVQAAEAIDLFCYQATKFLGAPAAALGGLDTLVFTGGIGEHSAPVRGRICEDLGFLGIRLDRARNAVHAQIVSLVDSPVTVRVVRTDEDLMIARHTHRLTTREGAENVPF